MAVLREVLNVRDVALELRCIETHVYNVINGKVKNVSRLPTITVGRLVQRATLEDWKRTNEHGDNDILIDLSTISAAIRTDDPCGPGGRTGRNEFAPLPANMGLIG